MTDRLLGPRALPLWLRCLLCAGAVALFSELFLNFSLENFRVSTSVMVLPVMLLTLTQEDNPIFACGLSAVTVLVLRTGLTLLQGGSLSAALLAHLPAALYYAVYGLLFRLLVHMRGASVPHFRHYLAFAACDLGSNLFELALDLAFGFPGFSPSLINWLVVVAIVRSLGAVLLLALYSQYHSLLTRAEHEERYQRLYLMKSNLRSELYFISKDKSRIEESVKKAYRLYEQLSSIPAVPRETSALALQLACDVHDLKKDYIRIEQGFHNELGAPQEGRTMEFSEVMFILRESTLRSLEGTRIKLRCTCGHSFVTVEHYALMSILRCLVNNSIEAILSVRSSGLIEVEQWRDGDDYCFTVADDGPGIPPKYMDSIFRMGFSTKYNASTGSLYRGMGLPNVKLLTEDELGGKLEVSSKPDIRTQFTLRIPAAILEVPDENLHSGG